MSSKFEQLLDYLVNEEQEKANELFHEIVVEKSRDIYESLIAEEEDEEDEEAMDESSEEDEEDESMEEGYEEEDETIESMFGEEDDAEDDEFPVQDKTDDFEDDVVDHEFGDGDDGDMEAPADKGDIKDLEDALEELKAEFQALMAGEKEEPEHADMFGGDDSEEAGDEEGKDEGYAFEASDDEEDEEDESMEESYVKSTGETMREYIEKVTATMDGGLVGGRTGETQQAPKEGKSPISSGSGKPTSGATAKNIAQAGKGADEDGTSPKGKVGGLVKQGGKFVPAGTHNVDRVKSGIKTVKPVAKVGNSEGQPVGSGKGDKAGQTGSVDTNSPLNGAPNRAK